MHPDKRGFAAARGAFLASVAGSSMVVRAGYGVYYNTSVYQPIATQMAQQPPLSKSLSVPNSAADPLTLANGFNASPTITPNTFAVDPNFRLGYAQNWQASVQRDLPAVAGTDGDLSRHQGDARHAGVPAQHLSRRRRESVSHVVPSDFMYLTSNGNSTREAGQFQLRRRLHTDSPRV